jgi:hypothetical protein
MTKVRKRRRLLKVVIAATLLVVAAPTVAAAHEHLGPVDTLDRGHHTGAGAEKAGCSTDPRDPRLMKPGAQLCHNDQVTADVSQPQVREGPPSVWEAESKVAQSAQVPTGQERAYAQHLIPPQGAARIDQAPAPSDRTEIEIWWMLGIVVAAGGVAGLIVGLRRGRPHALSS